MEKRNIFTAFKPLDFLFLPLLHGENRDLHILFVELAFFPHVQDQEPTPSSGCAFGPKKEPVCVPVSINILIQKHVVVFIIFLPIINFTQVPALEIRVNYISKRLYVFVDVVGNLLVHFPIEVCCVELSHPHCVCWNGEVFLLRIVV